MKVPALRVSGVAVAAQPMVRSSLSDWAGRSVKGVLGSDVLGRFGAVKLDLVRHTLTFAGAEGPAPTSHQVTEGNGTPPNILLAGAPAASVPVKIVQGPGTVSVVAYVDVANQQEPNALVVATGSPASAVSNTAAYTLGLAQRGLGVAVGGLGCTGSMHIVVPTRLTMGGSSLLVSSLRSMPINGSQRLGVSGVLGLDLLGADGTVVLDYRDAYLEFASG